MKNGVFKFEDKELKVYEDNGEATFLMKDVAEVLGYTRERSREGHGVSHEVRYSDMFDILENDGFETAPVKAGAPEDRILTESMVYCLVFKSNAECAKRFRRWLSDDVLPSIRKQGYYVSDYAALAQLNNLEVKQRDALIDKVLKAYFEAGSTMFSGKKRHYKEAWEILSQSVYEVEQFRRLQYTEFNKKSRQLGYKPKKHIK